MQMISISMFPTSWFLSRGGCPHRREGFLKVSWDRDSINPPDSPVHPAPHVPPTPLSPLRPIFSAEPSCSWLPHQEMGFLLFPGLDSLAPYTQQTTVEGGQCWERDSPQGGSLQN